MMRLILYRLVSSEKGEVPSSAPVGSVSFDRGGVQIDCQDPRLRERLQEFFSSPLKVRRPLGLDEGVLAFREVTVKPGEEEFSKEVIYFLRRLGLYGKVEGERKPYLIALDFDGVIWDSVIESFVVAHQVYEKMGGGIPSTPVVEEKFRRGRFLCRDAEDFYTLLRFIEENPAKDPGLVTEEEFHPLRKQEARQRAVFEKEFYRARSLMKQEEYERWCSLQSPYPGVIEEVKELQRSFARVVISTNKDEDSVRRLLSPHDLDLDVVSKEVSTDKSVQVRRISSAYKVPLNQIIFVDDLYENVRLVKSIGAKVAMVKWGYSTRFQQKEARKAGIPVLDLGKITAQLAEFY